MSERGGLHAGLAGGAQSRSMVLRRRNAACAVLFGHLLFLTTQITQPSSSPARHLSYTAFSFIGHCSPSLALFPFLHCYPLLFLSPCYDSDIVFCLGIHSHLDIQGTVGKPSKTALNRAYRYATVFLFPFATSLCAQCSHVNGHHEFPQDKVTTPPSFALHHLRYCFLPTQPI
jgi:hypothetical protein